jgi:hypothetical protein
LNSDSGCKEWKRNCLKRIVKKGDAVWKWSKGQGMEGTNKSILWRDKGIPECIILEKNGSSEERVLLLTKLKKIFIGCLRREENIWNEVEMDWKTLIKNLGEELENTMNNENS